jgi:hypothetical protein
MTGLCKKHFGRDTYGNGLLSSGAMIMMRNARSNVYELKDRDIDQLDDVQIPVGCMFASLKSTLCRVTLLQLCSITSSRILPSMLLILIEGSSTNQMQCRRKQPCKPRLIVAFSSI